MPPTRTTVATAKPRKRAPQTATPKTVAPASNGIEQQPTHAAATAPAAIAPRRRQASTQSEELANERYRVGRRGDRQPHGLRGRSSSANMKNEQHATSFAATAAMAETTSGLRGKRNVTPSGVASARFDVVEDGLPLAQPLAMRRGLERADDRHAGVRLRCGRSRRRPRREGRRRNRNPDRTDRRARPTPGTAARARAGSGIGRARRSGRRATRSSRRAATAGARAPAGRRRRPTARGDRGRRRARGRAAWRG